MGTTAVLDRSSRLLVPYLATRTSITTAARSLL